VDTPCPWSIAVGHVTGRVLAAGAGAPSRARKAEGFQGSCEGGQLVALPRREREGERQASPICHEVDLVPDAPSRKAKGMVLRLPGVALLPAPAAERLARIEVLSMHQRSKSMSPSAFSLSRSRSKSRSRHCQRKQTEAPPIAVPRFSLGKRPMFPGSKP
jgi:hypothetical protein